MPTTTTAIAGALAAVALLAAAPPASHAFTDGRLLPSYLCAAPGGSLPYTLGGVLKRTVFDMDIPLAFSADAAQNLSPNPPMTGTTIPDTAYMLASIHSSLNSITAQQNIILVTTQTAGTAFTAGATVPLLLASPDPNNNIDGTLIWAELANNTRVGSFTDAGGIFAAFDACGTNAQGTAVGLVHTAVVADAANYTGLSFHVPAGLAAGTVVAIHGLAVSDGGFGPFCNLFTV
ncbi:hypothetical protein HK405_009396, partial [Cladochytrium tenue]